MRFVPPAGVPLKMTHVLRALRIAVSSNGRLEACLPSVAAILKVKYVFGVSSGRAALWVILKSLQSLKPERDVVAIPAYTCFSVAASIVRAGLKIHPIEIDPQTLDFDFSQMDLLSDKKLLCVIPSNLFGFQSDLSRVTQIARSRGAFVLDDAAQALGATLDGEFAGTLGDVGFYSLGRGKAVSTMKGGLIVTNSDEIARAVQLESERTRASLIGIGRFIILANAHLLRLLATASLLGSEFHAISAIGCDGVQSGVPYRGTTFLIPSAFARTFRRTAGVQRNSSSECKGHHESARR